MPPRGTLTDREVLDRLLRSGKLTESEATVFKDWFDKLSAGAVAILPPKTRLWADTVYYDRGVPALRAVARQKVRAAEKVQAPRIFEAMPLPKRPPGR